MKNKQPLLPPMPIALTKGLIVAHVLTLAFFASVLMAARNFPDAEAAMAFYGVYHREPGNQIIHFFGVPIIAWTLITMQAHLPLTDAFTVELPGIPDHYPSWATLTFAFYVLFYFSIDLVGASLYFPFLYLVYATSVRWTAHDQRKAKQQTDKPSWTGTGTLLKWAMVFHVLAWYVQIHPGHKIIEGAQPAVTESIGGALTTAPLFAFYEGVWLVGIRKDFQERVLSLVADYTTRLCEAGANMRACASL